MDIHPASLPPELRDHPKYEVVRELGRGGMGVVYLARNRLMGRMEVLKAQRFDDPDAAARFRREIRSAAQLNHPNVVKAHAAVEVRGLLLLAMEYVEGPDLERLVKERGPLPVADACEYVRQAALGLQHALEKGMVHRDVKPQNLMLAVQEGKPVVKVLDFGIAKAIQAPAGDESGPTGKSAMPGTPDYIAPEQIRDATRADIRADIYSLGCTLYFLLTAAPPFRAASLLKLLEAHVSAEATPLNRVRKDVPAELAAVAARMMAKDPARRFQTPAEAALALACFVHVEGKSLPAAGGKPDAIKEAIPPLPAGQKTGRGGVAAAAAPPGPSPRGRRKKWLVGAGVVTTVLLAGLSTLWAAGVFPGRTADDVPRPGAENPVAEPAKDAGRQQAPFQDPVRQPAPAPDAGRQPVPDSVLVVDLYKPGAEVYVDGERMKVSWIGGDRLGEVHVRPGTRKVEIKQDGFPVRMNVTLAEGERKIVVVRPPPPSTADDPFPVDKGPRDGIVWSLQGNGFVDPPPRDKASSHGPDLILWRMRGLNYTQMGVADSVLTAGHYGPPQPNSCRADPLVTERRNYTDFRLRCRFKIDGEDAAAHVMTRADPPPLDHSLYEAPFIRGYVVSVYGSRPDLNGRRTGLVRLALGTAPAGFGPPNLLEDANYELARTTLPILPATTWHGLDIIMVGNRIQVFVDDAQALDYRDDGRAFRRGAVALVFAANRTTYHYRVNEIQELAAQVEPAGGTRDRWVHSEIQKPLKPWTVCQHVEGSKWVMSWLDGAIPFQARYNEVDRTDEYIELEGPDGRNDDVVRLYNTRVDAGPSRSQLKTLYSGGWEK